MRTRTASLREALGWPQHRLAEWLGVSQPTVSNLERGQVEAGPQSRLLDLLARENGLAHLTSDRFGSPAGALPEAGDGAAPCPDALLASPDGGAAP